MHHQTKPYTQFALFLGASLLSLSSLRAQVTSPPPSGTSAQATPRTDPEAIVLSPFQVNASKDEGFIANSSLAGGRLSTELKDTAAAYSVQTRDFLDALNLTDLAKAAEWSVNSIQAPDDGNLGEAFGTVTSLRIRGVQAAVQRDFFAAGGIPVLDSFNTERFDYARGPNAVLFGSGGIGGNVSIITKTADLSRDFRRVELSAGSWDYYRGTVDLNQRAGKNLGVRVNAVYQKAGGWQDYEKDERNGLHLAAKWRINSKLEIRASGERLKINRNNPYDFLNDQLSGWNGQSTQFSGPNQGVYAMPTDVTGANANQRGVTLIGNTVTTPHYVISNLNPSTIVNYAGFHRSRGGNDAATVPVGGVFGTAGAGVSLSPILNSPNVPVNRFDLLSAATGFRVPDRSYTQSFGADVFRGVSDAGSIFINYNPLPNLYLEAAAYKFISDRVMDGAAFRANTLMVDLTQSFADGRPNPGFLRVYSEGTSDDLYQTNDAEQLRVAAAYVFEPKKLGKFTLSAIAGKDDTTFSSTSEFYVVERLSDPRFRNVTEPVRYRVYMDEPSRPLNRPTSAMVTINGVTQTYNATRFLRPGSGAISPTENKYYQAALNGKLFKEKLVLFTALRRDILEQHSIRSDIAQDLPLNYDGRTVTYKPAAPADFNTLTYRLRNTAGVQFGPEIPADSRPRTTIGGVAGTRDPLYASDRFRDDFSPETVTTRATSYNVGGVYHLWKNISLLANYSESFQPAPSQLNINADPISPATSKGRDAGVRLTFLDQRVVASVQIYEGETIDSRIVNNNSIPSALNAIANASPIGAASTATNIRGLQFVPNNIADHQDLDTKGVEFELTANFTRSWRVILNAATAKANRTNAFKEARAYMARTTPVLRQILGDSGVLIGANNVAAPDPSVPPGMAPDAGPVSAAWNELFNGSLLTLLTPTRQREFGSPDHTINFYSDYRFENGFAKGFRLGAGVNYRGRAAIGNRLPDTIVNPANPAAAIDDPSVGLDNLVYRDGYALVTLSASKLQRITKNLSVLLDFRVENAFDYANPIYTSTTLRAPGGDITTSARVSTPYQYYYVAPRRYVVRAQFQF